MTLKQADLNRAPLLKGRLVSLTVAFFLLFSCRSAGSREQPSELASHETHSIRTEGEPSAIRENIIPAGTRRSEHRKFRLMRLSNLTSQALARDHFHPEKNCIWFFERSDDRLFLAISDQPCPASCVKGQQDSVEYIEGGEGPIFAWDGTSCTERDLESMTAITELRSTIFLSVWFQGVRPLFSMTSFNGARIGTADILNGDQNGTWTYGNALMCRDDFSRDCKVEIEHGVITDISIREW